MSGLVILQPPQLRTGMVVRCHGSRFRLAKCWIDGAKAQRLAEGIRSVGATEAEYERQRTLRSFECEYLGAVPGSYESIPEDWRKGWTVQGNHYTQWDVEL